MGRGKGGLIIRGNSFLVDFYYRGERFRPALPGLLASKKAHRKTAEDILTQIQADISKGAFNLATYFPDHPKAKRFRRGSDIKISVKLKQWLERKHRTLEATTWNLYKSAIAYHLIPEFGEHSLADLTANQVRTWMDTLNLSSTTINNALIPLRAILTEAYEDGLIDKNTLARISNLPRRTPEPDPFTREEMEEILRACMGEIRNLFAFAFWTGLRSSELIALKWKDINLKKGTAFIRHVRTRTGDKDRPKNQSSIRTLELLPPARAILEAQAKITGTGDHVFRNPYTGHPWKDSGKLRKAWDRIIKKSNVRYRKPYNTRHTFASLMLSSGAPPMWVATQMGHKDWGMIRKVYGRWLPDVDTQIQDKISFLWARYGHTEVASG